MKKSLFVLITLIISFPVFSQWVPNPVPGEESISGLTSNSQYVYAVSRCNFYFQKIKIGGSWFNSNNGLNNTPIYTLTNHNANLYIGSNSIFKSFNWGLNWFCICNQMGNLTVSSFLFNDPYIFCGDSSGILRTSNEGANWTLLTNGLNSQKINCIKNIGIFYFSGTPDGIYKSINIGDNWFFIYAKGHNVSCFESSGTKLFAGISGFGVKVTTNNGVSWENFNGGLNCMNVNCLLVVSNIIFAGTDNGVFASPLYGDYWTYFNNNFLVNPKVTCLAYSNNFLYAGILGQSVWKFPIADYIISVQSISSNLPDKYYLFQNYPNPFNQSTKISFQIAKQGNAKLIVYDIGGKIISTLVNKKMTPGKYEVNFDAGKLTSGVYFYKLITEDFSQTNRMILLK